MPSYVGFTALQSYLAGSLPVIRRRRVSDNKYGGLEAAVEDDGTTEVLFQVSHSKVATRHRTI